MNLSLSLFIFCAGTYAVLACLITIQSKYLTNVALAGCCAVTALWSATSAVFLHTEAEKLLGFLDLLRLISWYVYLLLLYRQTKISARWQIYGFTLVAACALSIGALYYASSSGVQQYALQSPPIAIRLAVCVFQLLLIENLYLNLPESARWHIAIPCVLLGGLACFDILVSADSVLFHKPSIPLGSARVVAMIIIAPLLFLAAFRGQRWREPVRLSRAAVFHSATLILSGSVLLAFALIGEVLRQFDNSLGWLAELSLLFAGSIGVLLFLSSRSARSTLQYVVVRHFFADRYDYRKQWLECIETLSGTGSLERRSLPHRAIRAIADVVDSPAGALFLLDYETGAMSWAGSWNMPSAGTLNATSQLVHSLKVDGQVVDLRRALKTNQKLVSDNVIQELGTVWLAIPLLQPQGTVGVVVVGPPRVFFDLDTEVHDLLKIVGREVATYITEQKATEVVFQTKDLHDYGKRFTFVAHDIKNVSSQLALLLNNAQFHIHNPEFQSDMLDTIRGSVEKIDLLLKRLDKPETMQAPASITPLPRLEALVAAYHRVRKVALTLAHDGSTGTVAMSPDAFDTAITHLLNNAIEAAPGQTIQIRLSHEAEQITVDIIDHGIGMSADFVENELFKPFRTRKQGGSGIGAFQARELITEAGGQLLVESKKGLGTTMRLVFARADRLHSLSKEKTIVNVSGE